MVTFRACFTLSKNLLKHRKLEAYSPVRLLSNFVEKKVDVKGENVNVVVSGKVEDGSQAAVLLMPGALGSAWTDFKPQIESLPALLPNYSIIAWDPPGYGKSIPPKRYFGLDFYEKDAETAVKLMQNLNFDTFDIIGWSDGGITGMIVAGSYPRSVRRLVVWGSNAYIHPDELKIYESIRDVAKWSPRMREPMENLYGKEGFAQLWSEWVDALIRIFKEKDGNICRDYLQNITAQTLVIHGSKDPMLVPEHVPYLLNNIKGSDIFVFKDGKHNIHLKYATEFNRLVSDFLLRG